MFQRTGRAGAAGANRDRESGQALLELALVTPILVLLIMAIFQFAYVIQSQMGLTNAVREAARRAAATEAADEATFASWVQSELTGASGLLAQNVQGYTDSRLDTTTDPPLVDFCAYAVGSTSNQQVTVTVTYDHPMFFPMLAFATDVIDGDPDGDWTLTASSQMRLENPISAGVSGVC